MKIRFFKTPTFSLKMFITPFLVLLDISLKVVGSNHFVNREIAMHARKLDEIYSMSKPGIYFDIIELENL